MSDRRVAGSTLPKCFGFCVRRCGAKKRIQKRRFCFVLFKRLVGCRWPKRKTIFPFLGLVVVGAHPSLPRVCSLSPSEKGCEDTFWGEETVCAALCKKAQREKRRLLLLFLSLQCDGFLPLFVFSVPLACVSHTAHIGVVSHAFDEPTRKQKNGRRRGGSLGLPSPQTNTRGTHTEKNFFSPPNKGENFFFRPNKGESFFSVPTRGRRKKNFFAQQGGGVGRESPPPLSIYNTLEFQTDCPMTKGPRFGTKNVEFVGKKIFGPTRGRKFFFAPTRGRNVFFAPTRGRNVFFAPTRGRRKISAEQ